MAVDDTNPPKSAIDRWIDFVDDIPVVGSWIAALLRLLFSDLPNRWIVLVVLFMVLFYPIFSFFSSIVLIQYMPSALQSWTQNYALDGFGVTATERKLLSQEHSDINTTNRIIDGSTLLRFAVGGSDFSDNTFFAQMSPDQTIEFATYQNLGVAEEGANCTVNESEATRNGVGTLVLKTLQSSYQETRIVPFDDLSLETFFNFNAGIWKTFRNSGPVSDPFDLLVKFTPNKAAFQGNCADYHVYVVMKYLKRDVN